MRDFLKLDGESLNHYGAGGGIHFCWIDDKGIATARTVTDDHVRQWFETTEDGRHYKGKGYRLVHLHGYSGPCVVPDVRRVDDYTLSLDGTNYTVSGSRMPDGKVNYHDLYVHVEVRGRTVEVQNYSIKNSLLEYLNNEQSLESQRSDDQPPTTPTLYARREPTDDQLVRDHARKGHLTKPLEYFKDVVLYFDKEGTQLAARHPWHYRIKPTRLNKWIMHDCVRYALEWLPDKTN